MGSVLRAGSVIAAHLAGRFQQVAGRIDRVDQIPLERQRIAVEQAGQQFAGEAAPHQAARAETGHREEARVAGRCSSRVAPAGFRRWERRRSSAAGPARRAGSRPGRRARPDRGRRRSRGG